MEPSTRESFPSERGWGWGDLRGRLDSIVWFGADVEAIARSEADRQLHTAIASITDWADQQMVSIPRAVRNLVAEAPGCDLPLWLALLEYEPVWPGSVLPDIRVLAAALRTAAVPGSELLEALLEGGVVSDEDLEEALDKGSSRPAELFVGRSLREHGPVPAADLVRMAFDRGQSLSGRTKLHLLKRAAYYFPPSEPLTFDSATQLSRHHITLLLRWPHLIRLLEGRGSAPADDRHPRTAIPVTGLVQELNDWRYETRLRTLDAALTALEAADYGSDAFTEMAADGRYRVVPEKYEERFRAAVGLELQRALSEASSVGAQGVAGQLTSGIGAACEFILTAPSRRAQVLRSCTDAERVEAIRLLHTSQLIATVASPGVAREDAQVLIEAIVGAARAEPVLAAITAQDEAAIAAWTPAIPDEVAAVWLEVAPVSRAHLQSLLDRGLRHLRPTRHVLRALAAADLSALPAIDVLALLVDENISRTFGAIDAFAWSSLYRNVCSIIAGAGWLRSVPKSASDRTMLEVALVSFPRPTFQHLVQHGQLLDPAIAEAIPLKALLEWLDANDGAVQVRIVAAQADRRAVPLPDLVRRAALARPDYLRATLAVAPALLSAHGLVERALESPESARLVDANTTPAERWSLLSWVRGRYADHPARAVANEVAVAFGLTYAGYLRHLASSVEVPQDDEARGRQFDDLYRTYQLPKKSGGSRTITVPQRVLRGLQRQILVNGFEAVPIHDAATGFRKGCSIRDNAEPHTGKAIVVNIDISSFFPSTSYVSIARACRTLCGGQLSPGAIRLVADICAYDGGLPIGAPTSPAIANVILRQVDAALTTAATRHGVTYTRYADDLTFSGDDAALRLIPFARRLLKELGYELDRRKTNIYRRGRRQIVTGLVVNERADLPRRTRRRLRAALHRREHGGTPEWHGRPMDDQTLRGWLAYAAMLRPAEGADALAKLNALSERKRPDA